MPRKQRKVTESGHRRLQGNNNILRGVVKLLHDDVAHWKSKAESYELDLTEANRHIVSLRLENLQLNAKLDQLAADNEKLHCKQEIIRLVVARPSPRAQADHYVSKFAVEKASK